MFTARELDTIDQEYFRVIRGSCYAITLQSRNTGHCWHILSEEYRAYRTCASTTPIIRALLTTCTDTGARLNPASARSNRMTAGRWKRIGNTLPASAHIIIYPFHKEDTA